MWLTLALLVPLLQTACTRHLNGVDRAGSQRPASPAQLARSRGGLVLGDQAMSLELPPLPVKGVPFFDQLYGINVTRVTDRAEDGYRDIGIKQEYARVDPENADGSRLVLRGNQGNWYLYDARSFRLLRRLPIGAGGQEPEPRWDDRNPRLLYHLAGMKLLRLDVESGRQDVIRDFGPDFPEGSYLVTGSEGDASLDRRYFCLVVKREEGPDWAPTAVLVFDRERQRIVGRMSKLRGTMNWVSMDMSGRHCLIAWDDRPIAAYSADLTREVQLPDGARGHGDLALTSEGKDVLVYQNVKTDWIALADLDSGQERNLIQIPFQVNTDIGLHFSGNAGRTPGWVLVSTYGARNPPAGRRHSWMDQQIFLLELTSERQARPHPLRVAAARSHTFVNAHQGDKAYFAEPQATINTRGTRVYWGSNWGQKDLQHTEVFAADLPVGWAQQSSARRVARP